jgi:hypothetical protein
MQDDCTDCVMCDAEADGEAIWESCSVWAAVMHHFAKNAAIATSSCNIVQMKKLAVCVNALNTYNQCTESCKD